MLKTLRSLLNTASFLPKYTKGQGVLGLAEGRGPASGSSPRTRQDPRVHARARPPRLGWCTRTPAPFSVLWDRMEWVLAEALLAQSQDPGLLLRGLCRGEVSAERVETLRFLLQRLEDAGAGQGALPEAARELAAGYLVPLLHGRLGGPDLAPTRPRRRVLRAAAAALRSCARLAGSPPLAATLAEDALRELRADSTTGAEAALEILAAVAPCLQPHEDSALLERVVQAAVALALDADGPGRAEGAAALVTALGQGGGAALRAVWDALGSSGVPSGPGRVGLELRLLSALAEKLLPESGACDAGPDARRCGRFWRTVLAGLGCAEDALTRKRARYLLQRAVEVSAERGDACTCGPQEGTGTWVGPGPTLLTSGN